MTWYARRGSKYGAKTQVYGDRKYHSRKEAGRAAELDLLLKAGEIKTIIPQYKVDLKVYGVHICNYYPDFYVEWTNGDIEIIEVKGFATELWRLKWKLFEAIYNHDYPHIKLTVEY